MELSFGKMPYHAAPTLAPDFASQRKVRLENRKFVRQHLCRACNQITHWNVHDAGIVHCGQCDARFVTHSDAELLTAGPWWQELFGGAA